MAGRPSPSTHHVGPLNGLDHVHPVLLYVLVAVVLLLLPPADPSDGGGADDVPEGHHAVEQHADQLDQEDDGEEEEEEQAYGLEFQVLVLELDFHGGAGVGDVGALGSPGPFDVDLEG